MYSRRFPAVPIHSSSVRSQPASIAYHNVRIPIETHDPPTGSLLRSIRWTPNREWNRSRKYLLEAIVSRMLPVLPPSRSNPRLHHRTGSHVGPVLPGRGIYVIGGLRRIHATVQGEDLFEGVPSGWGVPGSIAGHDSGTASQC
uniref:(northern house mosquito) hypothetical protein n=1 Tax=Culex pipiens TaxID=7175 RepID=A0A8D8DN95_CULPI